MREALRADEGGAQSSSVLIRAHQRRTCTAARGTRGQSVLITRGQSGLITRGQSVLISAAHVRRHMVPEGGQGLPKLSLSDAPVAIRVPLPKEIDDARMLRHEGVPHLILHVHRGGKACRVRRRVRLTCGKGTRRRGERLHAGRGGMARRVRRGERLHAGRGSQGPP
jgi:hypothetical protein